MIDTDEALGMFYLKSMASLGKHPITVSDSYNHMYGLHILLIIFSFFKLMIYIKYGALVIVIQAMFNSINVAFEA